MVTGKGKGKGKCDGKGTRNNWDLRSSSVGAIAVLRSIVCGFEHSRIGHRIRDASVTIRTKEEMVGLILSKGVKG